MAKDSKNNQPKKVNFFVGTFAELKQVSWPTFAQTMKCLGAVLVVTLAFLVVLVGVDSLLGFIHNELFSIAAATENPRDYLTTPQIAALVVGIALVVGAVVGVVAYKIVKMKNRKNR